MPEKNKTTVSTSQNSQKSPPEFNRILTGDCLEILPQVAADSIHFVVTSPPYNVGIEYDKHEDQLEYSAYRDWLKKVWTEVKRVLVPGGRFALNVAPTSIKNFRPIHYDLAHDFVELGFIMRTEILWYKQTIYRRTAWGSWKSPSNPHIMPSWEYILIFSKDSWRLEGDREKADITGDEFIAFSNGFWYIPPEGKRRGHPAPFPEELIYRLIKFYTYQDNVVLDMFGGTGTVALTAAKTKRQYLHIDISEEYNKIARRRLADYQAEQDQLALVDTQKHHADEQLKKIERRQEIIEATNKTYSSSD